MSKKSFIDSVEVKTPCTENWNEMSGNQLVRFCSHCSKDVNNLSEMTRKQAMRFVRANPDLCIRYIAHPQTNRPIFARQIAQITRRAPSVAAGVMTASIALSAHAYAQENTPLPAASPIAERVLEREDDRKTEEPKSPPATGSGRILGTAVDPVGAVIPAARVAIYSVNASKTVETMSDGEGAFRFEDLEPGRYRLEVAAPGFKTYSREVTIGTGEEARADAGMQVGGFELTVEVKADLDVGAVGGAMVIEEYDSELTAAVESADVDRVRELIGKGADVNVREKNFDKITPLFIAVETGSVEIVKLLLDYGAKINARSSTKQTPLMRLDEDATPELVDLLLNRGAKADLADREGNTALILAAESAPAAVVARLATAGADVNATNKKGQTALMNAANSDLLESVRALLLAGAQVNARNKDNETAWDLATVEEIEKLIETYGGLSGSPNPD